MAGYGNRTAPDLTPESLSHQHSNTRLGLTSPHRPPTYGAGFGNKRASDSTDKSTDDEDTHFNTQDTHGSAPYSNAHTYGSASTAGAGYGNKTGSFGEGSGEGEKDSTVGKVMEKIGGMVHSPGLVKKGHAKREVGASGQDVDAPAAN